MSTEAEVAGRSVLYIEDDAINVQLVERIIGRRDDLRLLTATQGEAGIDLAVERQPHVVLLDLSLPDISGEEVLRRLKSTEMTREIPVVVISGVTDDDRVQRVLALGAVAFVAKPYRMEHLLATIDHAIG